MSELKKITRSVPSGGMERPVVEKGVLDGFGEWVLDDGGLLMIMGKGKMPRWYNPLLFSSLFRHATPWRQMRKAGAITQVHISDGVTSIGNGAFCHCDSLTSIQISDSVVSIGDWAFMSCRNLTSIRIPNSVKSIGKEVFSDCTSLRQVTMPRCFDKPSFEENYGIPRSIVTFI